MIYLESNSRSQPVLEDDVRSDLQRVVEALREPGSFACGLKLEGQTQPEIEVTNVGQIELPLKPTQAGQIIEVLKLS